MVTETADRQFIEETERYLNQPPPTAQWYRADGVPLPNLLPSDPYHRALYKKKGWSLTPPANPQPIAAQVGKAGVLQVTPAGNDAGVVIVPPPHHMHVMRDKIGSPCLVQGCEHKRTKSSEQFKPRKDRGGH